MEKAPATWPGIPEHFKQCLVDKLDYKSRCRLRLCSRSDRDIVDTRPVFLDKLIISCNKRRNKCGIIAQETEVGETMTSHEMEHTVLKVSKVFEHKKSTVREFVFTGGSDKRLKQKLERLCSKLISKMNENERRLRVEKIYWRWHDASADLFCKILKICDPTILKYICIWEKFRDRNAMLRIMGTEQWKSAQGVFLFDYWEHPIENLLHLNQMRVLQPNLPSQDIEKVIESFIRRGAPLSSNFRIYTCEPYADLCRMVDGFAFEPTDDIYSFGGDPYFVKRLLIPSSEHVLVVTCLRISTIGFQHRTHHVLGMVCRRGHVEEDFRLRQQFCEWWYNF